MDWARLLGTLLLALLPGLAGWAWARHASRYGSGRVVVHEGSSLVVVDEPRPGGRARDTEVQLKSARRSLRGRNAPKEEGRGTAEDGGRVGPAE